MMKSTLIIASIAAMSAAENLSDLIANVEHEHDGLLD